MSWTDAKWFSDQAGQKTEVTQSSNVQRGRFHVTTDRGGASQSETKANLVNPDEIQRIGETELVALIGERPPVRLTQRRYFADDEVKDKSGGVPPLGPARLDGPLTAPVMAPTVPARRDADGQDAHQEHDLAPHHASAPVTASPAQPPRDVDMAPMGTPEAAALEH